MQIIDNKAILKIKKANRGSLFFTEYSLSFGSNKAVTKALKRLVFKEMISRMD
ncbi:DUF6088 family protein [Flavobacterium adhaerens]|uniref:DUF6088 family protein n=1 Tax=Flavobacterium adhaerens TaxID=3149043 RepID=UPI0034DB6775